MVDLVLFSIFVVVVVKLFFSVTMCHALDGVTHIQQIKVFVIILSAAQ